MSIPFIKFEQEKEVWIIFYGRVHADGFMGMESGMRNAWMDKPAKWSIFLIDGAIVDSLFCCNLQSAILKNL